MDEIWKDIPEYEGLYQVSNMGRVKGVYRRVRTKNNGYRIQKEIIYNIRANKTGYLRARLCNNGVNKKFCVHRLVMLAFHGPSDLEVNHIDGNKKNNCEWNLEYCTDKENKRHAYENELYTNCTPVIQYDINNKYISRYRSAAEAKRKTGIFSENILACCKGKSKTSGGFVWKYECKV